MICADVPVNLLEKYLIINAVVVNFEESTNNTKA
jgi:hypothetical protein